MKRAICAAAFAAVLWTGAASAETVNVAVYRSFSEDPGVGINVSGPADATGTFNSAVNGFTYDWTAGGTVGGVDANDTFAAIFTGMFSVSATGDYAISFGTDDAGYLFIDGALVASNPGQHSVTWDNPTLSLSEGLHSFRIAYDNSACCAASTSFWLPYGGTIAAPAVAAVPETPTWAMLGIGFAAFGLVASWRAWRRGATLGA